VINFVSNLPKDSISGGFSAANSAAYAALCTTDAVHYAGPINPPIILRQKVRSKLMRIAGFRGNFFFYSQQRLTAIADEVRALSAKEAQMYFFHGFTPWILTKPMSPYVAWSDCTFRDYINFYHRREQFRKDDLARIERTEAVWLKGARRILFTSRWAAERAVNDYVLDSGRVNVVGIFGEVEVPERDEYAGDKVFAFVSTNFEAKGGQIVLSAFRKLRARHADASLIVVGDRPSDRSSEPGVEFTGFLRKERSEEHKWLRKILAGARALVHPTKSDITPHIIVEAGYFGCPVISSQKFGIPELVDDGRTGILVVDPSDVNVVAAAMDWMLEAGDEYLKMRKAAWIMAHGRFSKAQYEQRLIASVQEAVSG
jgi:glycosyltransferase involved in cell wall biosynthesis